MTKLQAVAKEIENSFEVETAVIEVDFTSGIEIYDKIKDEIAGKQIGILVNNVGMGIPAPDSLLSLPNREKLIQDSIKCNSLSMAMMSSIVLPQMKKRKAGVIINISSLASTLPTPLLTIYSATKAYVTKFSQDLGTEYKRHGVIVQTLLTGPVACTNLSKTEKSFFMFPSAEKYVEAALKTVGISSLTTGYWQHSILHLCLIFSNFVFPQYFLIFLHKINKYFRNREIKLRGYSPEKVEH